MDWTVGLRGFLIGFSIAAPVGPIGILCIRRTLAHGRLHGLVSGLGAASADAVYGAIAGFGLTVIAGFLVDQQTLLRLVGGAFLCYIGARTLRALPAAEAAVASPANGSLLGAYFSTFALTITNPATIISFAAIFAGVGISAGDDVQSALVMVAGVFGGSAAWWFLLSGGVSLFRGAFTPARLRGVNVLAGVILLGFGLLALGAGLL